MEADAQNTVLGTDGTLDPPPVVDPPVVDPPAEKQKRILSQDSFFNFQTRRILTTHPFKAIPLQAIAPRLVQRNLQEAAVVVDTFQPVLATGQYLNYLAVKDVRRYSEKYNVKKGVYFQMNDKIGMDALVDGTLESSGIDSAKIASGYVLGTLAVWVLCVIL